MQSYFSRIYFFLLKFGYILDFVTFLTNLARVDGTFAYFCTIDTSLLAGTIFKFGSQMLFILWDLVKHTCSSWQPINVTNQSKNGEKKHYHNVNMDSGLFKVSGLFSNLILCQKIVTRYGGKCKSTCSYSPFLIFTEKQHKKKQTNIQLFEKFATDDDWYCILSPPMKSSELSPFQFPQRPSLEPKSSGGAWTSIFIQGEYSVV